MTPRQLVQQRLAPSGLIKKLAALISDRTGKNIVSNSAATALGCLLQLFALLCLSWTLAASDYAAFLVAGAVIGVAEVACDFGARTWAVRQFAQSPHAWAILRDAIRVKGVYSLATFAVCYSLPLQGLSPIACLLCAAIAISQPSADPLTWLLRGRERLDIEAIITLSQRTALALATILIALLGGGIEALLWGWLACNVLRVAVTLTIGRQRLWSYLQRSAPRAPAPFRSLIAQTFPLGSSLLTLALFHRVGVLTLGWLGDEHAVALFGTAHKIVSTTTLVATSVAVSYFPRIAAAAASGESDKANRLLGSQVRLISILFVPASMVGMFALPLLGEMFFSGQFSSIARLSALLMPGLYLSAVNIATKFTLNSFSLDWPDTAALIFGVSAFYAIFFMLSGVDSCEAAAVAWVGSEASLFAARRLLLRNYRPLASLASLQVIGGVGIVAFVTLLRLQWI